VDRWDRHRVLIATQVLAMLQSLTLAALTLSGHINMTWVIGLTFVQGLISAVEIPTRQSFVVKMVEHRADLTNAIAINSSNFNIARLVGPAVAGLVVAAIGEGYCFLVDGVSYIAVIAGQILHGGAHTLGFLMAAGGVGVLVCAIGLVLRRSVIGLGRLIAVSVGLFALGNIGLGMSHWFWVSVPLMAVTGYGIMTQIVASNTIIQTLVDDTKRGRVMAFYAMALQGSIPIGSLAGGALAARIGAPATLIVSGVVCLVLTLWFWRKLPEMKKIVRPRYAELGIVPES
jgi:MFS family permease